MEGWFQKWNVVQQQGWRKEKETKEKDEKAYHQTAWRVMQQKAWRGGKETKEMEKEVQQQVRGET
jgi:hypothetical protein